MLGVYQKFASKMQWGGDNDLSTRMWVIVSLIFFFCWLLFKKFASLPFSFHWFLSTDNRFPVDLNQWTIALNWHMTTNFPKILHAWKQPFEVFSWKRSNLSEVKVNNFTDRNCVNIESQDLIFAGGSPVTCSTAEVPHFRNDALFCLEHCL